MERTVRERDVSGYSYAMQTSDMDQMPYLQAVIKETLRVHPLIPHMFRGALKDDVLPLSKPLRTRSGKMLSEIPIAKGTRVVMSVAAYNRSVRLRALPC